jgi:biopolymer transport protein ExbB/TolQ
LSFALETGSSTAVLLLDMQKENLAVFPYPFTIQNFMWLMLGLGIGNAVFRHMETRREARACDLNLLPTDDRTVLVPKDLADYRTKATKLSPPVFLSQLINQTILSFQATQSSDQAHSVMNSMLDLELHRLELRYTALRYLSWLLPTLGFLGTVVGIAASLQHLGGGTGDDLASALAPVTARLAVAFNTTIMALAMSVILVLLTHLVQKREEEAMNAQANHCLENLINRFHIPT